MPDLIVEGSPISWVRTGRVKGRPLVVLAHGAGAPYTSVFMEGAARGLVARGVCVVRFHFPYMERAQRTNTRRPPDPLPRLRETWRVVLARVARIRGHGPVVIGGKSMGGRIASMWVASGGGAQRGMPEVKGLLYLGYPLHPAGRPDKLRADHLPQIRIPQLFVQGEKDALAEPARLRKALSEVPTARLLTISGADHSLARSRRDPMGIADEWLDRVAAFVHEVTDEPL